MSYAIIGDIHGDAARLDKMLRIIEREGRAVVFVGDYINRGPDSRVVVEMLSDFSRRFEDATFLWGNHEIELLRFLKHGDLGRFVERGGGPTLKSYLKLPVEDIHQSFLNEFPVLHYNFLKKLERFYENESLLVSHTGFDEAKPDLRSYRATVLDNHPSIFRSGAQTLNKTVVCGHYHLRSREPYTLGNLICVDTGCGSEDAPLTAVMLPERNFISC